MKLAIECLDPAASDDARLVVVSQRELNRLTNSARTARHVSSQAVGVQTLDVEIAEGFKRGRKKGDSELGHFGDAAIDVMQCWKGHLSCQQMSMLEKDNLKCMTGGTSKLGSKETLVYCKYCTQLFLKTMTTVMRIH